MPVLSDRRDLQAKLRLHATPCTLNTVAEQIIPECIGPLNLKQGAQTVEPALSRNRAAGFPKCIRKRVVPMAFFGRRQKIESGGGAAC
jgi:hypothetical protein